MLLLRVPVFIESPPSTPGAVLQDLAQAVSQQAQQLSALAQQLLHALLQQQHDGAATLAQQEQQQQRGQLYHDVAAASTVALLASLCDGHRMAVTSLLMATAPCSLPGKPSGFNTHDHCHITAAHARYAKKCMHAKMTI